MPDMRMRFPATIGFAALSLRGRSSWMIVYPVLSKMEKHSVLLRYGNATSALISKRTPTVAVVDTAVCSSATLVMTVLVAEETDDVARIAA